MLVIAPLATAAILMVIALRAAAKEERLIHKSEMEKTRFYS